MTICLRTPRTAVVGSWLFGAALLVTIPAVPSAPSRVPRLQGVACTWQTVPTPNRNASRMDNFLRDVVTVAPSATWAIGTAYVPEEGGRGRTLILHWEGVRWSAVRHSQKRDDGLMAIAGSSSTDVWAVGMSRHPQGLILHWDGLRWRRIPAVDPGTRFWHFDDVVAIAPVDVWAVGVTVDNGVGSTLISAVGRMGNHCRVDVHQRVGGERRLGGR